MKNKGLTLTEVLVSVFIFSITVASLTIGAIFLRERANMQYEKINFVNVLYDVNDYLNHNDGKEFNYFSGYEHEDNGKYYVYYDRNFLMSNEKYFTLYYYFENNELIITVKKNDRVIIDSVNYGGNRV